MRLFLRLALPLVLALGATGYLVAPLVDHLVGRWFQQDVELRSQLVFNATRDSLVGLARSGARAEMESLFRRAAEDERLLAMGLCSPGGTLEVTSANWPRLVGCPGLEGTADAAAAPFYKVTRLAGGPVLLAAFPLAAGAERLGTVVVLHDLGFMERRGIDTRILLIVLLAGVGLLSLAITVVVARFTLRRWATSIRDILRSGTGQRAPRAGPEMGPVVGEIRQLLRDLDLSGGTVAGIHVDWSPATLRRVIDSELPGAEVIVVSNREPYIHHRGEDGSISIQRPASGLVTALEPITRACGGTWIAHGSGNADRDVVDRKDRVAVPPGAPAYSLRRVWLTEEEEEGYYYGFANEGLWPLCHISFVRPAFRESDWSYYVAANRKFADAVVEEAKTDAPIVLVQDYHFALLPRMVRERLPNAIIVSFWHIPWPNAELFSICPWREEMLDGLLGSSIIGFHTRFHCNNFIETVDRFVECHIDREHSSVSIAGHPTLVRAYPISIEWPPEPLVDQPPVEVCRTAVRKRYGLSPETRLGVGVERFDFTKGIPDRLRAVERLFENHPEWIGRFVFLQVAAPTRTRLPAYQAIQAETAAVAAEINERFGRDGYQPILLVQTHHEPREVYELFRAADLCIVSSLHDGMNLVAKEFVAARDDEQGVLILSTFAGASRELLEALIVNPYDLEGTARAVHQALRMPQEDQTERMRLMRAMVRDNNVFRWASRMLLEAARIRKRDRIADLVGTIAEEEQAGKSQGTRR